MYRIYARPQDRLAQMLLSRFGRKLGADFWALRHVSFEVQPGPRTAVEFRGSRVPSGVSGSVERVTLPRSFHVATHDYDKQLVIDTVLDLVRRIDAT